MAFCNSCGATLNDGTKFCSKCGSAVTSAPAAVGPVAVAPPPPPIVAKSGGGGALKIILIVIAVIVGIGILGVGALTFVVHRAIKSSHVHQDGDNVKVETPFGTVESNKDPSKAAADLGIDIYPGAEVQKNGAASATFGNIRTVSASFISSDPLDKVCAFYKEKFPAAMSTSSDTNRCSIVSNDQKNMVTIHIEANGDGSKFQITNVSKAARQ
jgi:hypothetical protein